MTCNSVPQKSLRETSSQIGLVDVNDYLAMLGHELRNPLAGITAATEMARLTQSEDPRLRQAIGVLERQSRHVARIVDGLLEVSRIARGKIELSRDPVDIIEVMNNVLQDRIPHIEKRCLLLKVNFPEAPLAVLGDWVRLVQVFDNLMGNAIKFTQSSGTITVTVEELEGFARVSIADTGVGIRPEMLTRIFEPFLQEEQDVSRTAGGLGLGLSLAKNLVELHEGFIEARSAGAGKGAELVVRLPLSPTGGAEQTAAPGKYRHGKRILIVEDNTDAADMLSTLLELKGHRVSVARSGGEALNALRSRDADVVLCDIGLPGMNGYEFARAVRHRKDLKRPLLVAVTGYGQPEDRKRSKQAGFDEHLTKPVGMEALDDLLNNVA